jgi:hypothetical protein
MWLGGEDQDRAWHRLIGCKYEGQVGGFGAMDRTWQRSLSKELAPMDKGNDEEQARLQSMNQ